MVEEDREGDDKDLRSSTNITRFDKLLHILSKLWPPIISKHKFHGFVESKMA
jgi:hypothetical protein